MENFKPEQQIKKKSKYEEPKLQTTAASLVYKENEEMDLKPALKAIKEATGLSDFKEIL